jgi:hypothetical protein
MSKPLKRLKHHVTGAIERGEAKPIEAVIAPKHTPGPWNVDVDTDSKVHQTSIRDASNQQIATINPYRLHQRQADAALIAAAPEMLDALKSVKVFLDELPFDGEDGLRLLERVIKLVDKAEGKS